MGAGIVSEITKREDAWQQKATDALVARLNEQERQIQRVGARIETRKSDMEMLVDNQ